MGEVFVVWGGTGLLQSAAIARFWWVGIYFSYLHFDRCGTTHVSFRFGWKILADCNIIPYALPRFRLLAPLRGSTEYRRHFGRCLLQSAAITLVLWVLAYPPSSVANATASPQGEAFLTLCEQGK